MDTPFTHGRYWNDKECPLLFDLNQAAALCGVPVQQLSEWTDCGYIHAHGHGDRRRYDRAALRQVLALRNALWTHSSARGSTAHRPLPMKDAPERRRPEEFSAPTRTSGDGSLSLHIELYFALNSRSAVSARHLAATMRVPAEQVERVLQSMAASRRVLRVNQGGETLYASGRTGLHGPGPRELRIRARRRRRIPSDPL